MAGRVRLQQAPHAAQGTNGAAPGGPAGGAGGSTGPPAVQLRPLNVSGIVVRKLDLIEALRVYVPGLADVQVTEDGEHFWLLLGEAGGGDGPAAAAP